MMKSAIYDPFHTVVVFCPLLAGCRV